MLRKHLQLYAIRAREFSDLTARLGEHKQNGPQLLKLITQIKKRQALCISSGENVERYLAGQQPDPATSGPNPAIPVMGEQINEIREAILAAAKRYQEAAEEFCALASRASDAGLNQPDSAEVLRIATRNVHDALEQLQTAEGKLIELLPNDFP